jgi:hypothetical protein
MFSLRWCEPAIQQSDITGTQKYVLADGSASESVTFLIRSLSVAGKTAENVKGSVAPAKGDLLLGQSSSAGLDLGQSTTRQKSYCSTIDLSEKLSYSQYCDGP